MIVTIVVPIGWVMRTDRQTEFEHAEPELRTKWEQVKGESRLNWEEAKFAIKDAWHRMTR